MLASQWIAESFANTARPPFSFEYGDAPSSSLLMHWPATALSTAIPDATQRTLVWKDPITGLKVTCEARLYDDAEAVEWVLRFRNEGEYDTPILANVQALDATLVRDGPDEFVLHHSRGSGAARWDFAPLQDPLGGFSTFRLGCLGGRSSNGATIERNDGAFPFFDIAYDGGGVTCAIGWSGQWAARLQRDGANALQVTAGMERTHLLLHPGEEIRTPSILLRFWRGPQAVASNAFRRFMLRRYTPQAQGQPVVLPAAANTWFVHDWGNGTSEENQVAAIRQYVAAELPLEAFWLDAGWYGVSNWAADVGTWFPKTALFPRGLKPVGDEAHKHGLGFVLWFEPERVQPGTWLFEHHRDWLIVLDEREARRHEPWVGQPDALLNLGNPEALRWLTDFLSDMIREAGVTVYRQDFNFDPLAWWRSADAPDRQGISEIRHIEGLYALWDELLRRHPGLLIDNCASGGRRIDLETARRSVPLWRTDYGFEPDGQQCHTLGLSRYIPCSSTGTNSTDPYIFRSALSAGASLCWNLTDAAFDADQARRRLGEYKLLRPLFYGDIYPLTLHSTASDVWCAYQLDRPDLGQGAVVAFRRQSSPYTTARFRLQGLDRAALYDVTDLDCGATQRLTGEALSDVGLEMALCSAPASAILTYQRVPGA